MGIETTVTISLCEYTELLKIKEEHQLLKLRVLELVNLVASLQEEIRLLHLSNCKIYADKIHEDSDLNSRMQANQNSIILTPVKKEKGQTIVNAAADIYSYLVSQVRQPVESLFNWLIKKSKFSSHKG